MIRGDLSGMWRGGGRPASSSSSRGASWRGRGDSRPTSNEGGPSRGTWRGTRGSHWRGGKDSRLGREDRKLLPPLGKVVTEFKLDDASTVNPVEFPGEARIVNCAYAASYSLTDEKPSQIIAPGMPAVWDPPSLPRRVARDEGTYLRDQNGARFPVHPIQPAVQALLALDERLDPSIVDVVGCASSLGDILRFVRSVDSTFRFDVELVGNTLFMVRNGKSALIPDIYGYGHSFLDQFTSFGEESGRVKSHQRIISYDLAGLKCLIRFECDGYMTRCNDKDTILGIPAFRSIRSTESDTIRVEENGMVVPQESILEIKTRSAMRGDIDMSEHLPRLWLRQIPYLVSGYHVAGNFADIRVQNICKEVEQWETENQDGIKRFVSILRQIIAEVKKANHVKLELCREGVGPLQLREREETAPKALPVSWERIWIARSGLSSEDGDEDNNDDDDGDETYPLARTPSGNSDDSQDGLSFDYTDCSVVCGYCGNCG